mgnify:FL=1|tara:strand:+ start:275 stop:484 length:210 start_codon:yes stop_codon:yes gene_type:complete
MNKYKQATKFMRSGCQKDKSHTPHYVIITDKGFIQCPFGLFFISKKEAKEYANENVNNYYEIHKDYFVE